MRGHLKIVGVLLVFTILEFSYEWKLFEKFIVKLKEKMEYRPSVESKIRNPVDVSKVVMDKERIRHRFDLRRKHVTSLCSHGLYQTPNRSRIGNIIVVDDYKLLYCSIPKTGCTNWKRIFLVLRGQYNSTKDIPQSKAHQKFKTLTEVTDEEEREKILKTYKKVMILREPFSRILSAYRNKFEENNPKSSRFRKPFVSHIIKKYGGNKSVDSTLMKGNNSVTFREFVQYLGDTTNDLSSLPEEHWRETHRLCLPCEIDYDYVGHFETLHEDSRYILNVLKINLEFPASTNPTNASSVLQEYYNKVNSTEIKNLKDRYRIDSLLFDSR